MLNTARSIVGGGRRTLGPDCRLAHAREIELRAARQSIENRMQWTEISTTERLEAALRQARRRSQSAGLPVPETNQARMTALEERTHQ